MVSLPLAFLDIETTGGSLRRDRMIEIGILRVEEGKVVATYQSLINPNAYLSPFIESLTGITGTQLEKAPRFSDIKADIMPLLSEAVLVAHNARFDYGFLKNELKLEGISFSARQLCTVKLSRKLFPFERYHNLDALIQRFGFLCENRHRAFDDAKVLVDFYHYISDHIAKETVESAIKTIIKRPSLPAQITEASIDALPKGPGVYIFYGEGGVPLYVGKSKQVRTRVLSHFADNLSSSKELKIAQQIVSIEAIPTAGELGALLKEASLIKKMQPLYNVVLRNAYKVVVARHQSSSDGYSTVELETLDKIYPSDLSSILGVFRSKKTAEALLFSLAKDHGLCHKLLGLEKTKKDCFPYRLGNCRGACIQEEQIYSYNSRFAVAFAGRKIKPWPFPGAIGIKEEDLDGNSEVFVLDKWCFLGSMTPDQEGAFSSIENTYTFDMDMYKIFYRYLKTLRRFDNIIRIPDIATLSYTNPLPL